MKIKDESFYKLKNMVPMFYEFTDEELINVLKLSVSKIYQTDARVFQEREIGTSFFVIAKGSVNITKRISSEFDEYLLTMTSGNYFGEMAIIDNMPRSANAVVAEDNTVLLEINKNVISQNLSVAFKFFKNFSKVLAGRLRKTNEKLLEVSAEKTNLQGRFKFFVKTKLKDGNALNQCNFKGTDLAGVFFNRVSMKESMMTGANLSDSKFKSVSLADSNFCGSDFHGIVFNSCDFTRAQFTNASFEKSLFKNCKFDDPSVKEIVSA